MNQQLIQGARLPYGWSGPEKFVFVNSDTYTCGSHKKNQLTLLHTQTQFLIIKYQITLLSQ